MYHYHIGISYLRNCLSYGDLWFGDARGGISCLDGAHAISTVDWQFATYTRDAIALSLSSTGTKSWRSYGYLGFGSGIGIAGIFSFDGFGYLGFIGWNVATK